MYDKSTSYAAWIRSLPLGHVLVRPAIATNPLKALLENPLKVPSNFSPPFAPLSSFFFYQKSDTRDFDLLSRSKCLNWLASCLKYLVLCLSKVFASFSSHLHGRRGHDEVSKGGYQWLWRFPRKGKRRLSFFFRSPLSEFDFTSVWFSFNGERQKKSSLWLRCLNFS